MRLDELLGDRWAEARFLCSRLAAGLRMLTAHANFAQRHLVYYGSEPGN
jgi:hypothetical protein